MNNWRKPCEHGRYDNHTSVTQVEGTDDWVMGDTCSGWRFVTASDLEGEKVWWCEIHRDTDYEQEQCDEFHPGHNCGWRLLIPITVIRAEGP